MNMPEINKPNKEIVLITAGALALGSAAVLYVLKNKDHYTIFTEADNKFSETLKFAGSIPTRLGQTLYVRKAAKKIFRGPNDEPFDDTEAEQIQWLDDNNLPEKDD